jgi:penicillin G amidase
MRKILIITGSVILVLLIILTSVSYVLVQKSFTPLDGTVRLQGITSEVQIYRDSWGVPHIYAQNEADLFFAQGYVQAQDRLWQMELHRRMAGGTLSEIFGESTLAVDKFSRATGLMRIAVVSCSAMDKTTLGVLDSYCSGVNAFLKANGDNLPVEFSLLGFKPAPWVPADSLSVSELIAWGLGKNWEVELLRGRLVQKIGAEKAGQLLAPYPDTKPLIVPPELLVSPLGTPVAVGLHGNSDIVGSNNWVIDGEKSMTGKPLLANDPHLSVMMPSIWHETGLHAGGFDVTGVSLPGCPLVIIGRNKDISWGVTNLPADTQDLFIEKINPANPLQYEHKGQWKDMQVVDELIKVRGHSAPEEVKIRLTVHGPIMDNVIKGLEQPLAMQWAGNCRSQLLESAYMLDKSRNWDEFHHALRYWDAPSQNIVYADNKGNIGYQATGLLPIRGKGWGMVPAPGWTGEYDWTGYIPYEDLPSVLNPSTHFIATANNKVVSDNYSYFMGYDWSPPYRAQRITGLLTAKEKLSVQDFQAMHADVFDIPAQILVPYMTGISPVDSREEQALDILKKWDFNDRSDAAGPAIFHVFYVKMLKNTLQEKLGDKLFNDYAKAMGGSGDVHTVFMIGIIKDNTNSWFDDTRTVENETRDTLLAKSFSEAVAELGANSGAEPSQWKWGLIHYTEFSHPLARVPGLSAIFSRGPVPTPGSRYTVNVAAFDYNNPYGVVAIPSYRQIIDWSNPDKSLAMHSTGQSGLVFSKHYDDMISSWLKVQYHTMLFNKTDVQADRQSLLMLVPASD